MRTMYTKKRMMALSARPARHRAGKRLDDGSDSSSESSANEGHSQVNDSHTLTRSASSTKPPAVSTGPIAAGIDRLHVQPAPIVSTIKPGYNESDFETVSEDESETEDGSEDSEQEDSEKSNSSEESSKPRLFRPVFVKKTARVCLADYSANISASADRSCSIDSPSTTKVDTLVQEQLEKNARARAEGKAFWDDENVLDEVDDTDGLDYLAELTAWRLRELKRVKRERDLLIIAENQREEIERRRNLTAEERVTEDRLHLDAQKAERDGRGQMGYMQKYFHKGAFFANDSSAADLAKRDVMGGRYADDVMDRATLPQYMQIRDMTKLGKKGRTRYKDMRSEDTGQFGASNKPGARRMQDSRDLDNRYRNDDYDSSRQQDHATGSNSNALGTRKRAGDADAPGIEKRIKPN